MFHTTFVQIALFELVDGATSRVNFRKIFKILLLKNRKEDEVEIWHTYIKLCFLFRSDKNSGCYGNLKFNRLIMGKVEI